MPERALDHLKLDDRSYALLLMHAGNRIEVLWKGSRYSYLSSLYNTFYLNLTKKEIYDY
jgi:negative regulator of sigma E activity